MIDTDIASLVPEVLDRQDRPRLNAVPFAEEVAFQGYPFRLEAQVEFRRLDDQS